MLSSITSPTLLISEQKVRNNLARMAARAARHSLAFRPHFKTHQSEIVGNWCREAGVTEITVTSLRMAEEFAQQGWEQITIAMPVNPREFGQLTELARSISLSVFLADPETAVQLPSVLNYFVEIDAGYGRSGINWQDVPGISAIISAAGEDRFRGLYVHSGHTYDAEGSVAIAAVHQEFLQRINFTKSQLVLGAPFEIAMGDTPACSTQEDFRGITSLGPGNFIYFDLTQAAIGACTEADIGVCLAAPVVQVHRQRQEVIIHGGWVQLGKDQLADGTYGRVVELSGQGEWGATVENAQVVKLSQEHGTVKLPPDMIVNLKVGDLIGIVPVHACATVHGMRNTGSQIVIS